MSPAQVFLDINIGDAARTAAGTAAFEALHGHFEAKKSELGLCHHADLSSLDDEAKDLLADSFRRKTDRVRY